ncbi:hypothetical protein DdX_13469 [Ditylenchus destructor]|uniref:Uncharacterized protein n=1 Tax=Ditylenchus destructor TaxID=166010 RepID=A0AAD4QZH5_9BILA|nr:hypothetical protein DdX_13469 [Ditylenchus destructor]
MFENFYLLVTTFSSLFALILTAYFILVMLAFCIASTFCSTIFDGSDEANGENSGYAADSLQNSYLDCSLLYMCFPCKGISLRQCMRNICPTKKLTLRQFATCECIRPTMHGNQPPTINFVCCAV